VPVHSRKKRKDGRKYISKYLGNSTISIKISEKFIEKSYHLAKVKQRQLTDTQKHKL
jgi:hypothetical protein